MADALVKGPTGDRLDVRLLMARWAEVSPAALVAWADRQRGGRDGFYVQNAIEAIISANLPPEEVVRLVKLLENQSPPPP